MSQAFRDLNDFVRFLEERGELKRIKARVTWDLEITEITQRVLRENGPALLFENVEGYRGTPVLINLYGTEQRAAWALGVDAMEELPAKIEKMMEMAQGGPPAGIMNKLRLLGDLVRLGRIGPRLVEREDAPAQEVIMQGDDVDLLSLPILKTWPQDAGRYITLPLVITKDPDTGTHNLGMYRVQVYDKNTTGMHWQTHKVGTQHERATAERGAGRMEVAVALGGDPALIWAGSAPLPADVSEYVLAGFLRGAPVPVVKGITVDLDVPAQAEYILEGYVDPSERRPEGPFGDHTGYYSVQEPYPVFHVTAITRRRNPIYPTIVVGRPPQEDYWMGVATERLFLPLMRLMLPEIVDVHMPAEGVFHNLVLVSIKKEYPGHVQKTVSGMWGLGLMSLARAIAVFDDDVDIHDPSQVVWRLSNNVDPRRDIFFADGPIDDLDVASPTPRVGSKIGIDATRKSGEGEMGNRQWMPDITMDADVVERVTRRWKEYGI